MFKKFIEEKKIQTYILAVLILVLLVCVQINHLDIQKLNNVSYIIILYYGFFEIIKTIILFYIMIFIPLSITKYIFKLDDNIKYYVVTSFMLFIELIILQLLNYKSINIERSIYGLITSFVYIYVYYILKKVGKMPLLKTSILYSFIFILIFYLKIFF